MLTDSLSVFSDANELFEGQVVTATKLNSNNETWQLALTSGDRFILKYFQKPQSGVACDHFEIEASFYLDNAGADGLPRLVHLAPERRLLVTSYIEQDARDLQWDSLFAYVINILEKLMPPSNGHFEFPTSVFLPWGSRSQEQSSAQHVVMEALRDESSLVDSMRRTYDSWEATEVVHGDLKLDNIISTETGCIIVDWESCGLGPRNWNQSQLAASWVVTTIFADTGNRNQEIADALEKVTELDCLDFFLFWLVQYALIYCAELDTVPYESGLAIQLAVDLSQGGTLERWNSQI